jgi:DTW domain-containing protein
MMITMSINSSSNHIRRGNHLNRCRKGGVISTPSSSSSSSKHQHHQQQNNDNDDDDDDGVGRKMCYICFRTERLCICRLCEQILIEYTGSSEKLKTATVNVTILQDRDEFKRKLGSAYIVQQMLENSEVIWKDCSWPNCVDIPKMDGVLLWPSEDAMSIETYLLQQKQKQQQQQLTSNERTTNIIVLDSTWYKAKRMYNRIPWLKELPAVKLQNIEKESAYKFRKQPFRDALSTCESIALALAEFGCLENTNLLNVAFEAMIDEQLEETKRHERIVRVRN